MALLAPFRARGLTLTGGAQLRVVGKASVVAECRSALKTERDALLGELRDEAEKLVAGWPLAYRRWTVQTVAYLLRLGYAPTDAFWKAYRDIRDQYNEHRAYVAGLPVEDQMLRAALDTWPGAHVCADGPPSYYDSGYADSQAGAVDEARAPKSCR